MPCFALPSQQVSIRAAWTASSLSARLPVERVKIGGASAGSLLAACIKSGMPLDNIVEQNLRLLADLRQGGTRGRLGVRGVDQHPH